MAAAHIAAIGLLATCLTVSGRAEDLQKLSQDPNQWVMAAHDYANTRFSPLDQINRRMSASLQVAWMFSVGVAAWSGSRAAHHRRHDVCRQLLSEQGLRARRHDRRSQMDLYAEPGAARPRASPAATWSRAASPTTTARSSLSRSTTTSSRSTPRPARSFGRPRRRHQPRRNDDDGAPRRQGQSLRRHQRRRAGRSRRASPRSTRTPARSSTSPTRPAPTRTC